jgi:uncharacterized membrane protein YdjX (TVP38/TMEM64 family)
MQTPPPRQWSRPLLLLVLLAAATVVYLTVLRHWLAWDYLKEQVAYWKEIADAHFALIFTAYFLFYVACTSLSVPSSLGLSLVAGALFGLGWGLLLVSIAATIGASLAFLSTRYLFRDWVQQRYGEQLAAVNRGIERDGAWYLLAIRLTPAIPFFVVNAVMGLTPMPLTTYAVVSFVGMLPVGFLTVWAGSEMSNNVFSPTALVSLGLMALVPLVLRWLLGPWVATDAPLGEGPAGPIDCTAKHHVTQGPTP